MSLETNLTQETIPTVSGKQNNINQSLPSSFFSNQNTTQNNVGSNNLFQNQNELLTQCSMGNQGPAQQISNNNFVNAFKQEHKAAQFRQVNSNYADRANQNYLTQQNSQFKASTFPPANLNFFNLSKENLFRSSNQELTKVSNNTEINKRQPILKPSLNRAQSQDIVKSEVNVIYSGVSANQFPKKRSVFDQEIMRNLNELR